MQPNLPDYLLNLPAEHRNKQKFAAFITALTGYFSSCATVAASIPSTYDLDTASGAQLDTVGLWLGQTRVVPGVPVGVFFGFLIGTGAEGDPSGTGFLGATPFGEEGVFDASIGPWYEEGSTAVANAVLDDPTFLRILKAQIQRNTVFGDGHTYTAVYRDQWGGNYVNMQNMCVALFPSIIFGMSLVGTRQMTIHLGRTMTALETAMIAHTDVLPRPAGVKLNVTT